MTPHVTDTIVAIATPCGKGGIGIVRLSGLQVKSIAKKILHTTPSPRTAHYATFYDGAEEVIDQGIALFFATPDSFTGEDVLELHAHGSPIVLDCLLRTALNAGARLARPGEFSERAFLNNKIDLTQAEAIADLIDAASEKAAKSAIRSLQGEFSKKIYALVEQLITLRTTLEATLDFPEEVSCNLTKETIQTHLEVISHQLNKVLQSAQQGSLLREGLSIVIAGLPNVGKSSLLNALSGRDAAIVTNIPGTTRDIVQEYIQIDGLPIHVLDTAGLCETANLIEQEGVDRAQQAIEKADHILFVTDITHQNEEMQNVLLSPLLKTRITAITLIKNKIDLTNLAPSLEENDSIPTIALSAKRGTGLDLLKNHLKQIAGFQDQREGLFTARRRHIEALRSAQTHIHMAQQHLIDHVADAIIADELKETQHALSEITGVFTPDDLLDRIFSTFCVGK